MIFIYFSKKWQIAVDILFTSIFDPEEISYYKNTIIDNNSILAIEGNQVIGFLLLSSTPDGIHKYQISYIAVDERYRHKGVATKMVEMVDNSVWLEVLNSNIEACNFYIKKGFKLHETFTTHDGFPASIFINARKQELPHQQRRTILRSIPADHGTCTHDEALHLLYSPDYEPGEHLEFQQQAPRQVPD
jgi:GNAT superfamily N-acetyltransferase